MFDNYVCISITDFLDRRLSDGTTLEFIQDHGRNCNSNGLNSAPTPQTLLDEMVCDNEYNTDNCAFEYIILWSDSFLRCFIRQK